MTNNLRLQTGMSLLFYTLDPSLSIYIYQLLKINLFLNFKIVTALNIHDLFCLN